MKLTERMLSEKKQYETNLTQSRLRKLDEDNDDMDYMARPAWHFINEEGSVYDHKDDKSLNTD